LAKFVGESTGSHSGSGTFGYTPPEAHQGRLTKSCDLYALAGSYAKLRTGQEPFGKDPIEAAKRQTEAQHRPGHTRWRPRPPGPRPGGQPSGPAPPVARGCPATRTGRRGVPVQAIGGGFGPPPGSYPAPGSIAPRHKSRCRASA
jgi:hypothetical protein